ncbi:xanthine dehydrogenase small subunit [Aeromicrobium sp.]|uniref:xanthine dehydrogenase small subunit n=1 Tax=Aeromicrobium sp. TaxID=1871063 RepID=UPI002FC870CC
MPKNTATVNGTVLPLEPATPHVSALDWLRDQGLTGAKEGCAEGECGACSIMVARPGLDTPTEWVPLNACLMPAATLIGQEVITSEGLGSPEALHPVQREMALRGGSQCGYCTPGFVCSMAAEFYRAGRRAGVDDGPEHGPNGFDLHALSGNLCRCTGYRPIRDAAYALGEPDADDDVALRRELPPPGVAPGRVSGGGAELVRPSSLAETLDMLAENPEAVLVAGATDHGVEVNLRGDRPALTIAIDRLDELRHLEVGSMSVEIGAALSLTEIDRMLGGSIPIFDQLIPQFASRLIRNSATLGGNLGTGSPIGDAPPVLLALDASVVLASRGGDREVPLADYFTGYRRSVRRPDEIIRSVRVPMPVARTAAFHKIAKRRFDDISSVAIGLALDVEDGLVTTARIGLGGVAATPIRARATEAALAGMPWTRETAESASLVLAGEGTPLDDHRASARYRAAMLGTALRKLYAAHEAGELV